MTPRVQQAAFPRRSGRAAVALGAAVVALVVAAAGAAAFADAAGSASTQTLTLYSYTTKAAFLNTQDDRARGSSNNPFGVSVLSQPTTKETGNGPFPGDLGYFQTNLYTDSHLKQKAGTGTFSCQYAFNRIGVCNVTLELHGGSLVGTGDFSTDATTFSMAIKGGTGRYLGQIGQMNVVARAGQDRLQKLQLTLHPA